MFYISDNSEEIFKYLDENYHQPLKLNQSQVFILDNDDFHLILYTKSDIEQNFTAFKIIKGTDFRKNATTLLAFLQDQVANGYPEFDLAVEELSEYLMGLYPENLFFDAH